MQVTTAQTSAGGEGSQVLTTVLKPMTLKPMMPEHLPVAHGSTATPAADVQVRHCAGTSVTAESRGSLWVCADVLSESWRTAGVADVEAPLWP